MDEILAELSELRLLRGFMVRGQAGQLATLKRLPAFARHHRAPRRRRIGDLEGDSADAILARAERRVREGDLEGALSQLQSLPEPARDAMADWTARAERRVEIERRINALRAQALGDLSGATVAETGAPL